MQHFYFDHNATTPVAPEVLETMVSCLGQVYGNASSIHHFGQSAKQRLEAARRQVAALIHATPAEIVFTSGGTEADNLAIFGAVRAAGNPRPHLITSTIEHAAVLAPMVQLEREGAEVTRVPVAGNGIVNPEHIQRAIRPETVLVSVMHANNELGTLQPIAEIARITRNAAGVPLHVDGVQALGKIPVDVEALGVDLYLQRERRTSSMRPREWARLYVRKGMKLAPLAWGGHQERDRRPGTENVPGHRRASALRGRTGEPGGLRLRCRMPRRACATGWKIRRAGTHLRGHGGQRRAAGAARPTPPISVL